MNRNMAALKLGFTGLSALIYLVNRAEYYGTGRDLIVLSVLQKQIGLTH